MWCVPRLYLLEAQEEAAIWSSYVITSLLGFTMSFAHETVSSCHRVSLCPAIIRLFWFCFLALNDSSLRAALTSSWDGRVSTQEDTQQGHPSAPPTQRHWWVLIPGSWKSATLQGYGAGWDDKETMCINILSGKGLCSPNEDFPAKSPHWIFTPQLMAQFGEP